MKLANIDEENLLNGLRNFNEIFRKSVAYNNIKSHKKAGLYPPLENTVYEKPQGAGSLLHLPPLLHHDGSKDHNGSQHSLND